VARFEEGLIIEAIRAERPTLLSVVPTMLTRLLDADGLDDLRSLRAILVGGAAVPADTAREWSSLGLNVCPSYGLTETCSQVAMVPPGRAGELAGTAGLAGSQAAIDVVGGEIVVSGPAVFPGYVNPEVTPAPAAGRFATGDLGHLEGSVLSVLGRRDDTIITGGENVRPEQVEGILRQHPGVRDVAVAGRPDPTWGQVVTAWVVAKGTTGPDLDAWCRDRLDAFKVPRRWTFVEELPRTEGGKLRRGDLL
jgi:O-succinylbenzoic acid--CoA ligase